MVGEIEATLINLGLAENTLVVFTSDNGPLLESTADLPSVYGRYGKTNTDRKHLLRGSKGSVWEGGVRVACLMKWPAAGKIPAGSVCNELIAGFDLYTTFAAIAGAQIPRDRVIDGKDITPLMFQSGSTVGTGGKGGTDGESVVRSPHDAFYYYQANRLGGVRQGKWKLMLAPGSGAAKKASNSTAVGWPQLFDLETDISETMDVSAKHPDIVRRLESIAETARDDLGDSSRGRRGRNVREPGRLP
jgi:arylsulfatase A-like enzyme